MLTKTETPEGAFRHVRGAGGTGPRAKGVDTVQPPPQEAGHLKKIPHITHAKQAHRPLQITTTTSPKSQSNRNRIESSRRRSRRRRRQRRSGNGEPHPAAGAHQPSPGRHRPPQGLQRSPPPPPQISLAFSPLAGGVATRSDVGFARPWGVVMVCAVLASLMILCFFLGL